MSGPVSAEAGARGARSEAYAAGRSTGDRRWLADRLLPFFCLGLALPLALFTAWRTLDWLPPGGRLFPGFFVMQNGVVPTVGLFHWTGMTYRMPFAARIVAVDGVPVHGSADVYAHAASVPVGTTVEYTIEKDGVHDIRRVPTMRFERSDYAMTLGLFVADGLMGLLAGFVVALLRPRVPAARAFLLLGFFWGLFPLTGTSLYDPQLEWLAPVYFVMQAVFPATFIHFGLVFPVERQIVRRHPALLAVPYAISTALLAWIFHSYFAEPPSWLPVQAAFIYSGVSMPILLGLVIYSYWEKQTPMVRPRLQAVIPGLLIATFTAIYGFLITGFNGDFPMNLIAITPVVFFGTLAYAITAHDAFDINRLLRRTALYFALTLVVTGAYAAVVAAASLIVPAHQLVASTAFQIAVFVSFGFLFEPIRNGLQRLIDATFFRHGVDYRRAVGELSAALTSVLDLREIFERVGTTVSGGFALESFAAVVWAGERVTIWEHHLATGRATERPSPHEFPALRTRLSPLGAAPLLLVDYETGTVTDPAVAAEVPAPPPQLVVPLVLGDGQVGAFLLGRKRSGLPFGHDDLELLRTLSAQCAIAIQNAISYRSLQELATSLEDRVRRRTAQLESSNAELAHKHAEVERSRSELATAYEQLRSTQRQLLQSEKLASLGQLVAGVAHEINNPVSFIVGNLRPLARRLDALNAAAERLHDPDLRDQVTRLTEIVQDIGSGAERTAGIVRDLRTFSRINDAPRSTCDVHESLEVALRLLKPKWSDRITIQRSYGDVPLVRAVPGQLNQVFMNLLANACDAIQGAGTVRIRTSTDDGQLSIAISDDGSGIPADRIDRIFDPFYTTKGQGQGTGLGLSISHGIVADHGGRLEVDSQVGSGTTFTVVLPIQAPAGAGRLESPSR